MSVVVTITDIHSVADERWRVVDKEQNQEQGRGGAQNYHELYVVVALAIHDAREAGPADKIKICKIENVDERSIVGWPRDIDIRCKVSPNLHKAEHDLHLVDEVGLSVDSLEGSNPPIACHLFSEIVAELHHATTSHCFLLVSELHFDDQLSI